MPDHFEKFIFVGAVVALALFSRLAYSRIYQLSGVTSESAKANSYMAATVPLFVPTPPPPAGAQASSDVPGAMLGAGNLIPGTAPSTSVPSVIPSDSTVRSPFTRVGNSPVPPIAGEASLIADLKTGTVYLGTNTDQRWPLASVTKLMTASLVIDDMDLGQKVTIPPEAVAMDPSQQLLTTGETFTVSDLLRLLLLPSSNVAAETLADYYGRARFIGEMNARAQDWGMAETYYGDPSGLSAVNQSTPTDLLRLSQKVYADYPQILAISRTPQATVTDVVSGKSTVIKSINNFSGREDFIGGKTGYTSEAAGNLLSLFKYENRPILIVVMGTSDDQRFDNTLMLYSWFAENYK